MNESTEEKAESAVPKEQPTEPVTFVQSKKNVGNRIVNVFRPKNTRPPLRTQTDTEKHASKEQKAIWNKEFARLNRSLEFHTDFGLKTVAFFYAAVGGVLSVFFGGKERTNSALLILVGIPMIMSLILSYYFFYGARIWDKDAEYMRELATKLGFEDLTRIELLSELLRVFGFLFVVTGVALMALLIGVLIYGCCLDGK